ncbi:MAG: MotA/TolQ/ExbB proton channel family protein [Verrucomicrobiota bacterium]
MPAAGFTDNFSFSLQTLLDFFRTGGWFIFPIVVCWFISVTVIIWKALDLRRRCIIPPDLAAELENVGSTLRQGKFPALQARLQADPSILARLCRVGISGRHTTLESASRATETAAREEVSRLERGIPVLEIIFTIAPMLGLIGTVSGLVRIFSSLGTTSAQSAAQAREIAHGIAEAMNTTIAGLVVAVPAIIAQVLYSRQLERIALRLSTLITDFLDTCWSHSPNGG